jgi:hypothetical protein
VNLNFFSKKRKRQEQADALTRVSHTIDVQLKTFSSHLKQIDSEYQALQVLLEEIKKSVEAK